MTKQERIEEFVKSYGELVERLDVDFANYPMFIPDGQGSFKIVIQSTPIDMIEQKEHQESFIKTNETH